MNTKALINCMVTAQLICTFVFTFAKSRFSRDMCYISGICGKCGKKVVGEVNGCNAMEQVFHIACFVCISCGK